jgi:hypothetical protein
MADRPGSSGTIAVSIEAADKKTFAKAVDWPGWARSGKTEALALEALAATAPRYAVVAAKAGEPFEPGSYDVVDSTPGGSGTEFGVPSVITDLDHRPTTAAEAERLARLVTAAWTVFDRVAAASPAELRKGPRGGGRDRDKMIGHVIESEWSYARQIGIRLPQPDSADRAAIDGMRAAMLEALARPSDGSPIADRNWPPRYAAGRIAWHALDHAWEMEDRREPSG